MTTFKPGPGDKALIEVAIEHPSGGGHQWVRLPNGGQALLNTEHMKPLTPPPAPKAEREAVKCAGCPDCPACMRGPEPKREWRVNDTARVRGYLDTKFVALKYRESTPGRWNALVWDGKECMGVTSVWESELTLIADPNAPIPAPSPEPAPATGMTAGERLFNVFMASYFGTGDKPDASARWENADRQRRDAWESVALAAQSVEAAKGERETRGWLVKDVTATTGGLPYIDAEGNRWGRTNPIERFMLPEEAREKAEELGPSFAVVRVTSRRKLAT